MRIGGELAKSLIGELHSREVDVAVSGEVDGGHATSSAIGSQLASDRSRKYARITAATRLISAGVCVGSSGKLTSWVASISATGKLPTPQPYPRKHSCRCMGIG